MKKRIFRMIGIVLCSVFGFTGAVFGVMALMGKFKTPVIYPTVLGFEVDEQVVVERKTFNTEVDWESQFENVDAAPTIESFILSGRNPKFEEEVNKRDCYIWFDDAASSNLITLCNKYGRPLQANSNNRYLVKCNEPIYYMINRVADDAQTDGKVVLNARSVNETLKRPENPMTIWIDRQVKSVFVDYSESEVNSEDLRQYIHLGIDMSFDFNYLINTPLSLEPISKESAKEIELFYDASNLEGDYGTDYYKVTASSCEDANTNSPVSKILEYEDGVITFTASSAGVHKFIIAVFPTYQTKIDYYASIEGEVLQNPNHDRTLQMLLTELTVTVEDIEISKAGLSGSNIVLDLYAEDNYIYINNELEANNLGLYMKKGELPNQVDDYTRFNEVNMNGFSSNSFVDYSAKFSSGLDVWDEDVPKVIETTKQIGENWFIIDCIYDAENEAKKYYCNNGVAVLDTNGTEETEDDIIKVLKPGSYLNFYILDSTTQKYSIANFDYVVSEEGIGRDKKWQIVVKEKLELESNQKLHIAVLVANNRGEFKEENYFDSIPVNVNELELTYDLNDFAKDNVKFNAATKTIDMAITFDAATTIYPDLQYSDIITNLTGSYKSFVYVIEEGANSMVETLSNIKFVSGGKTYVLVGYTNSNGDELNPVYEFVNEIKLNQNVASNNKTCNIYMLQLKHAYGENINSIITSEIIVEGKEFDESEVAKLETSPIVINAKYLLNTALLDFTHGEIGENKESKAEVYENTDGHTIYITSTNTEMLAKILEFYGVDNSFVKATLQYSARISIQSLVYEVDKIVVGYNVGNALLKPDKLTLDLWLEVDNIEFDLGQVTILNGSPDEIILKTSIGNVSVYTPQSDVEYNEEYINSYITVTLGYLDGNYTYTFNVNGSATSVDASEIFNNKTLFGSENYGFQDADLVTNKGQNFTVYYSVADVDKEIFNTDKITFAEGGVRFENGLIGQSGTVVLHITIGSTTGHIKVETITDDFTLETKIEGQRTYEYGSTTAELTEFVKFKHNGTDVTNDLAELINITNVRCVSYGDGTLSAFYNDETNTWELKKSEDADYVLTIKNENGWKFIKNNYYVPLSIQFNVESVADFNPATPIHDNVTINVNFSPSISVGVSDYWADRIIYAGTKVSLQEKTQSIFAITRNGDDSTVKFKIGDTVYDTNSEYVVFDEIGEVSIKPVIAENEIDTAFTFYVKPNVIADVKTNELVTERTTELGNAYIVSDIYDLQAYNTNVVYGDNYLYDDDNLVPLLTLNNLTFKVKAIDAEPSVVGGVSLQVGALTQLGVTKQTQLSLMFDTYTLREDVFTINNAHTVEESEKTPYKALVSYENFASVDGYTLKSIEAEDLTISVDGGQFKIETIIIEPLENVDVTLTFEKDGQKLTFATQINILPYTPETKNPISTAYSGSTYDLFNGIYDSSLIADDELVNKLWITRICDANKNNVSTQVVKDWVEGGSGYTLGVANPSCSIEFNEIGGKTLEVLVEFTITYTNDKTYTYYVPLTINNRQTISVSYPEKDVELDNALIKFRPGFELEALEISGLTENSVDGIYELNDLKYEAVLVYTNSATTINFGYDELKKLIRVKARNVAGVTSSNSTNTNFNIEVIAYQNNGGMLDYVNKINKVTNGSVVVLPAASQGIFGTIIFKLSTASGNYAFYNVYIYSKDASSAANINSNTNLEVLAKDSTTSTFVTDSVVNIDSTTTYKDLVKKLTNYYSVFKTEYNENITKIYLYDVEVTGETEVDNTLFNLDVTNEYVKLDKNFNTITLGLVMEDGVQKYCYGTITLYVQPTTDIAIDETDFAVEYEKANGEFTATILANSPSISSPFGEDWVAELVDEEGELVNIASSNGTSVITLDKRVEEETLIRVKYTLGNTIAFVNYSYLPTTIPTQSGTPITIGGFDTVETGFKVTETLTGNSTYMATYSDEYTVECGDGVTFDSSTGMLTFTQTYEDRLVNVKITYTNFSSDESNERIFTFKVLAGVYFKPTSGTNSGLTSTERHLTDVDGGSYSSSVGSVLSFTKKTYPEVLADGETAKYYVYQVAGLTIYTHVDSKLVLTFDDYRYVASSLDADHTLGISESAIANFVHMAKEKDLTVTITVQEIDSEETFAQRNLYLTLAQTYTTLKANYLTDGATHENVISNSITEDLATTLLTSRRIKLVGTEWDSDKEEFKVVDGADLTAMGFKTEGNPNEIKFKIKSNATLKSNGDIQFNVVSTATLCEVYLNNNFENDAGIEEDTVYYVYQIMPGDKVDGLDYAESSGYVGTNYVSFELNDHDNSVKYTQEFILGEMLDFENNGQFSHNEPTLADYGNVGVKLNDNKQVVLAVSREIGRNTLSGLTQISITLGGVNGYGTIAENLTIVFSNHIIEEPFKENVDNSIYAGYKINLFEDADNDSIYDDGKFIENNGVSAPSLTYELAESTYTIKGQTKTILASQTNNNLFIYDETTKTIQTNAVASDVYAELNFTVKSGSYVIKTVTYKLNIYMNMKIVVNGDEDSALETNFILTNKTSAAATTGNNFPLTIDFIDGSELTAEDVNNSYYKALAYDVRRIKSQQNYFEIDKSSVKITLNSAIDASILEVSNNGIIFKQDYSGDIELKLSIETKNGTYETYWTIYVTPILEIQLAKAENSILQTDASVAFNSGTTVQLISDVNNRTDAGVGVVVNTASRFEDYILNSSDYAVKYSYKIYTFDQSSGMGSLTSENLYKLAESVDDSEYFITSGNAEGMLTGHNFAITLPNVPSTIDVQSYLVVYEVYIEYLDLTKADNEVEVLYVTYNVINKQKVYAYTYTGDGNVQMSSAEVNVDRDVDSTSYIGKYYLYLFYYEEAIDIYKLTYADRKFKLNDGSVDYEGSIDGGEIKYKENDAADYQFKYNISTKTLYRLDSGVYKSVGVMTASATHDETYHRVFDATFNNIVEYKNFIDLYLYKKYVYIGQDNSFTLVEISSGKYGINLNENGGTLFNNELKQPLTLQIDGVSTVVLNDFRLYANNSITVNTNGGKGYSIGEMGLINYFTPTADYDASIPIIGVGEPKDLSWVNGANAYTTDGITSYGTIDIPNGTENNTYKLYKVTYTGTGSGASYYTISSTYYYIYYGATNLVVPNYSGIETYLYSVAYDSSATGNVELDLTKVLKVWSMNEGYLVSNNPTSIDGFEKKTGDLVVNYTSNKLSVSIANLNEEENKLITGVITLSGTHKIAITIEFYSVSSD